MHNFRTKGLILFEFPVPKGYICSNAQQQRLKNRCNMPIARCTRMMRRYIIMSLTDKTRVWVVQLKSEILRKGHAYILCDSVGRGHYFPKCSVSIAWSNGLAPDQRQAISWGKVDSHFLHGHYCQQEQFWAWRRRRVGPYVLNRQVWVSIASRTDLAPDRRQIVIFSSCY